MTTLVLIWKFFTGTKLGRIVLLVTVVIAVGTVFLETQKAAAVERDRLVRELADEKALRLEAERQLKASRVALDNEMERAVERAEENYLLRVEIDAYKADIASGVAVACPADDAYTDRMRALWNIDGSPR